MKKFPLIFMGAVCITIAALLAFLAFRQGGISLYMMPNQIMAAHESGQINPDQRLKAGGVVVPGSVKVDDQTAMLTFKIEHEGVQIPAKFDGLAPALFEEGSETILEGWWRGDIFVVDRILAKHDEDYTMPERHKEAGSASQ